MKNYLVYLFAILNASIVGLSFLFTKTAIQLSSPVDTLAYRFTISFFVLLFLVAFKVVKVNLNKSSLKKLIGIAVFYPILFFSFQAFGLHYSQSSEAGILFASTPILTTILASFFLKERTTIVQKIFIFLSVFGVIFIFIMKGQTIELSNILGISLLLFSCISIASYTVMARSLSKTLKPIDITFFMLGLGFLFFNTFAISAHVKLGTISDFFSPMKNITFILSILFLGVLASLVTSFLSNYILSKLKASQMSVFSNLSTVVAIAAGAVILNEQIYWYDIVGSCFIIFGVIGTNFFNKKTAIILTRNQEIPLNPQGK
jgi:drug/metabolite transporter (DMT)-like permease